MAKKIRFKIGDVFIIPLEDNLKGVGRVLQIDEGTIFIEIYRMKPIRDISEYNYIEVANDKPIVFSWCYNDALQNGEWEIIDNRNVEEVDMPYFWHQDAGDRKDYIQKGTTDSFRTFGERIKISKNDIFNYEPEGIGNEISVRNRYLKRLREAGLN
ncbi:MAG: hypothetical protein K0R15_2647 [Clostridiales bacterium]|jgi:hypothetical protein|nr:hypothetical protein [Clostridiales bacterium]